MYENKIYYDLKYEPREIQIEALNFTKTNINRGKKYILLNLPTGIGKSFYSVMFMNWYLNYVNDDARFDLLTNSKILQKQYVKEFDFIQSLKGKNSYTCDTYNTTCDIGKEFNRALKKTCTNCPYDKAVNSWLSTKTALTNFHLFNTLHLFANKIIDNKKCNVLIIDEADNFESVLCDYISMKISYRSLKLLGFSDININHISTEMIKIKNIHQYIDYINNIFINKLENLESNIQEKLSNYQLIQSEKIKLSKNLTNITSALSIYNSFIKEIEENDTNINNWSLDIDKDESNFFPLNFIVQPVWSKKYLHDVIFKHYDHIIFMSATILDKDIFSNINGLDVSLCSYYSVDSPFDIKNRPIYFPKGIGKMTFNDKKQTWENQKRIIDNIINKNHDKKGIIHTTNYEISKWLEEHYKNNKRFIFHTSETRDESLFKHMQSTEPTILVSPSMMNGVDLRDNLSRFQIIMKIPYPNISSNKIKKRQKDLNEWYNWKTCCDLIQMYGRSIRNESDYAETYILDDSFSNILKFNYKYLPNWFTNAIKILKF